MIYTLLRRGIQKNPKYALINMKPGNYRKPYFCLLTLLFTAVKQVPAKAWCSPTSWEAQVESKMAWILLNEKMSVNLIDKMHMF